MSTLLNPRKGFNFRISFPGNPGMPVFSVQKVTSPDSNVEAVAHGVGNTQIKTAGQHTAGDAKIERIIPATKGPTSSDVARFFRDWQRLAQDPLTGGGSDPLLYKHPVLVEELANDGLTVLNSELWSGTWPTKINGKEYSRTDSENLVETVDLSVDVVPFV